jgi:hypothetical protein
MKKVEIPVLKKPAVAPEQTTKKPKTKDFAAFMRGEIK